MVSDTPPKLAVIIPCYNYEHFVGRAIASVVRQNRDDCELVVVDDGSTDGSWDVIVRSGVTAYQIPNGGQRAACLFGVDRTQAPFIMFLDADDELTPGSLDTIIGKLDHDVAKLQFSLTRIDGDDNVISEARPTLATFRSRDDIARQVLRTGVYTSPPTSGNVFRRDVCELLREVDYDQAVDGVILFAAPFMGDIVSVSNELGRYRIHGKNDSGLGSSPDAQRTSRDIARFLSRMDHLRAILQRIGTKAELVDPRDTLYFQELNLCALIGSGRRISRSDIARLLKTLFAAHMPPRKKAGMAIIYGAAYALRNEKAKALMAYRFYVGDRSALGLVRSILSH